MATTPNRNYPLPVASNPVRDDVARLIAAFEAIDGDVAGLLAALATKAAAEHGHSLADIAGLVDALNGKASVGHTHSLANLSDVSITGAPVGRPLTIQPGGKVGIGPDWAATIAAALSAGDVQDDRNDVSSGAKLVRVDGALAAALATHGNYYSTGSNRNIDTVAAGDAGLYYDGNPGTWPLAPAGRFWWVTTQRVYTGDAVVQRAFLYASSAPDLSQFEYIRIRSNTGGMSSWRRVFHEDQNGNILFSGTVSLSGLTPVINFQDTDNGVTGQIGSGTTDFNVASNKPLDLRPEGIRAGYISATQWLFYTSEQLRARLHDGGMEITGAVDATGYMLNGKEISLEDLNPTFELTLLDSADSGSTQVSLHTWTGLDIGGPDAGRQVLIAVGSSTSASGVGNKVVAVTIGGIAAKRVDDSEASIARSCVGLFLATVPTGTTADVSVQFNYACAGTGIILMRLDGTLSEINPQSVAYSTDGAVHTSRSHTGLQGTKNAVLISAYIHNSTGDHTWSGDVTEEAQHTNSGGTSTLSVATSRFPAFTSDAEATCTTPDNVWSSLTSTVLR
ncbi:MAG: hypothetical protein CMN86_05715 [Stappia sp.]|nr:hypothetical protein [Stappia sp.]